MKLRTTVQISSAIQKKPPLKREDSFLKRFSTRQIPETQVSSFSGSSSYPIGNNLLGPVRKQSKIREVRVLAENTTIVEKGEIDTFENVELLLIQTRIFIFIG